MLTAADVTALQAENTALRAPNAALRAATTTLQQQLAGVQEQLAGVQEQLAAAQAQIEKLEAQLHAPPAWVKPNSAKPAPKPRRKRAPAHNRARRRDPAPTRIVQHAADTCPDCGYPLRGQSLARRRQVIDLPPPMPVDVTEHQLIKRWCPHCEHWVAPADPLRGVVLGRGRLGVRLTALIAYLRVSLRLPVRVIVHYLRTMHQLTISSGEIVELLHRLRTHLQADVDALRAAARASPHLHGDETGWREGGQNGYIWAFSTPDSAGDGAVRYYEYDKSRGAAIVQRRLHGFQGVLSSDFLGSYNIYAGPHQRCWVHLLRDVPELKERHAADAEILAWAQGVRALYDAAHALVDRAVPPSPEEREALYVQLVEQAHELGLKYSNAQQFKGHPCYGLSKRLLRHEGELFQFVLVAGLSDNNNQAERSIRPLVVVRKISRGSRSAAGTKTRMGLFSLLETWRMRGRNPFEELLQRLQNPPQPPLPQI
ncbi:MAG TPA: IS66 family transposase [Chloroflexia bacterium]|nr:IS66 family transposase [Chloroflexia bacterium]